MTRHPADHAAGAPEQGPTIGGPRSSPAHLIARGVLTLLLIGAILWLLIGNADDLEAVGDALASVTLAYGIALVALLLVSQVLNATQLAATVPGLGLVRGLVAVEGSAAASNIVPGPSGTATRLLMLRSWGFATDAFARSWLFTSTLTNLTVLAMPAVAVIVVAIEGKATGTIVLIAALGLALAIAAVVVVVAILRSERVARRVGAWTGSAVRWARGIAHRAPTEKDFIAATLSFRASIGQTWHERGVRITLAVVGTYVATGAIYVVSMRAVGLDRADVTLAGLILAYTTVRLLTIVNFTPGGVGVTEALYVGVMLAITGGDFQSEIVAGVILFRGLTYAGPILLGAVALLLWRFVHRWRAPLPAEDPALLAVTAAVVDREVTPGPPPAAPHGG